MWADPGRLAGPLFYLSGVAALVYQVAWQRMLVLHSGVGLYSVAMVTAAFMAGLGLGSHLGGVLSARLTRARALAAFAAAELGVAVFAAASTWLYYDVLYVRLGHLYDRPWLAGVLHFVALLVPTTLMGSSLPLLVRALLSETRQAERVVARLYGLNVLGAATGALVTPWWLLRQFGLDGAVGVGALLNLTAALGSAALVRAHAARTPVEASESTAPQPALRHGERPLPLVAWAALYALSGFCAMALEMLWFRLADVGLKANIFSFGTVLALYLLGLAAGSLVAGTWPQRLGPPLRAFLFCQASLLALAALVLCALVYLPPLGPLAALVDYFRERRGFRLGLEWDIARMARLYLLWPLVLYGLPTFFMGVSFVALQRAVHDEPRSAGRKVGLLQAANIAGCTAGSLVVGLWALTHVGTTGVLRGLCAIGALLALFGLRRFGMRTAFAPLLALLLVLVAAVPGQDALWQRWHGLPAGRGLIEEDATAVIAMTPEPAGEWWLWINGRSLSTLPYGGLHTQLGALPVLVHPRPRAVAVIGLGSGDTAWAAACRAEAQVRVFELCAPQERVLRRLTTLVDFTALRQLLHDPRLDVRIADGRHAIERGTERYDVIEADALLPEASGSGNVYSLEFFQAMGRRLNPGGLMCSWAPTPRTRTTFARAFPHVIELQSGRILIGSNQPLPIAIEAWQARLLSPAVRAYLGPARTGDSLRALQGARPVGPASLPALAPNRDLFPRDELALGS
jgi:predicted membrane-bound spermidine synthase